jgi:hypothetical protein
MQKDDVDGGADNGSAASIPGSEPLRPEDPPVKKRQRYSQINPEDSKLRRYLKLRVVNILEAVMLIFGVPQVASSREFVFLPIDLDPKSRMIKREIHMKNLEPGSTKLFYPTKLEKYLDRPSELEDVTYTQFYEQVLDSFRSAVYYLWQS